MCATLTVDGLLIPEGVGRLEEFCRWVETFDEESPRVHFYRGHVAIEMSPQDIEHHLPVASEINARLRALAKADGRGEHYGDGGWYTCPEADVSTEPDGFFVLWETLREGAAVLVRGRKGRALRIEGRLDMALEVVSDSSVQKDTVDLVEGYARAGIGEYWLVDPRGREVSLRLLVLAGGAYCDVKPDGDGFLRSPLWGRSFRLTRSANPLGRPSYDLEVRSS